jgi:hypothetical protein
MTVLEYEPAEILRAPARFLASENDVARRHRGARREQIDAREWRLLPRI